MVLDRNSHRKCSIKQAAIKNFAKLTGNRLCYSLFFNKVEGATYIFSCEFCEISRTPFSQNISGRWKSKTRVMSSDIRIRRLKARVARLKARAVRLKARVRRLKARVRRLKARVGRFKARVEAIKPRVK